jgi:hypothetical protein
MEEVNYIDQVRMVAVDHPADVDVFPDERFLDDPPFASGKTVATSQPHLPAAAWDNQGRDVLQLLSARDHRYVRDFTNLPYAGFANSHSLTLDLGKRWTAPGDLTYYYEEASTTGPFSRFRGSYTRYGDVTPLLTSIDNQFVILGTGEDIDAEFDSAALPPLRKGWKRDYFFYANGFVKDMDFYEATPFTVADMPFHGMSTYPYPVGQHYPDDARADEYRFEWNDRFESGGNSAAGYRFVYGLRTIDPWPLTPNRALSQQTFSPRRHGGHGEEESKNNSVSPW